MTSLGENIIYVHSGNRPSLEKIWTSTTADRTGTGYLNAEVVFMWPEFLFLLNFKVLYCLYPKFCPEYGTSLSASILEIGSPLNAIFAVH